MRVRPAEKENFCRCSVAGDVYEVFDKLPAVITFIDSIED